MALVWPTGGYFTRAQLAAFLGVRMSRAGSVVGKMVDRKITAEEVLERRKVCRIRSSVIYRVLGLHPGRGFSEVSTESIVVRLLSLDYVIEHPGLLWLLAEQEKVRAFGAAGIPRELLPSCFSGRAAPGRVRYFLRGLPVAFDSGRVLFAVVRAVPELQRSRRAFGVCRAHDPFRSSGAAPAEAWSGGLSRGSVPVPLTRTNNACTLCAHFGKYTVYGGYANPDGGGRMAVARGCGERPGERPQMRTVGGALPARCRPGACVAGWVEVAVDPAPPGGTPDARTDGDRGAPEKDRREGAAWARIPGIRRSAAWAALALAWLVPAALAAQGTSPWVDAVNELQTQFTGPIARGLSLIAIVIGGLMFAFGEGGSKRTLAGIIFGLGMAMGAANFLAWLF